MIQVKDEKDSYLASFAEWTAGAAGRDWVRKLRQRAIQKFETLGFPTLRDEEWKYTNVARVARVPFQPSMAEPTADLNGALASFQLALGKGPRLVFLNGHFNEGLSDLSGLPSQARLSSLAVALESEPDLEKHFATQANYEERSFVALNTAFVNDGMFLHLPAGTVVAEPIHLLYLTTASEGSTAVYPRSLIVADDNAQVALVEDYASVLDDTYLTNAVTEVVIGQGAEVEYLKLLREGDGALHVHSLAVDQGRDSRFYSHSMCFSGQLIRNNIDAHLSAEGAECTLNGLTVIGGEQHVDNQTRIVHAKPHCNSWEVYKNILSDHATGVFNGKIYVNQDAQKTDAKQTNQSLLLSDQAVMNSKPELEIYADDVKCTHGATVGELDKDSLFYLRARGIDRETAQSLLIYAFASDVVSSIRTPNLREAAQKLLFERLPSEFTPEEL